MLIVSTPLKQEEVRAALDGYNQDGVTIRFVRKMGIQLQFDVIGAEGYAAVDLAKAIIRSHPFGNALYFSASWQ